MGSHTESLSFWDKFLVLHIYTETKMRYERVVKCLKKQGINNALNGTEILCCWNKVIVQTLTIVRVWFLEISWPVNYNLHSHTVTLWMWASDMNRVFFSTLLLKCGGVVVKALRYKPTGRGFDSRWCQEFSPWHNPAGRTMALGSTQPLTEMSTRCVSCHQECCWG